MSSAAEGLACQEVRGERVDVDPVVVGGVDDVFLGGSDRVVAGLDHLDDADAESEPVVQPMLRGEGPTDFQEPNAGCAETYEAQQIPCGRPESRKPTATAPGLGRKVCTPAEPIARPLRRSRVASTARRLPQAGCLTQNWVSYREWPGGFSRL
jgi:hypothetical protein